MHKEVACCAAMHPETSSCEPQPCTSAIHESSWTHPSGKIHLISQHTRNKEMDEETSQNTPDEVHSSHRFQEALVAWNDCTRLTTYHYLHATGKSAARLGVSPTPRGRRTGQERHLEPQSANIWLVSLSSRARVRCLGPEDPVAALIVGRASAAAARSSKNLSNSEEDIVSSRGAGTGWENRKHLVQQYRTHYLRVFNIQHHRSFSKMNS